MPELKDLTPEQHLSWFVEYADLEQDLGGPDPQLELVSEMIRRRWSRDAVTYRAWAACCYVSVYTVSGGEVLWHETDPYTDRVRTAVHELWPMLGIRAERKLNGSMNRERMTVCLESAQRWVTRILPELDTADYSCLWRSAQEHLTYMGRYATCKLLETLRRVEAVTAAMPDIRPNGGKFPRRALTYFYPEHSRRLEVRTGGNSRATLEFVNEAAERARGIVNTRVEKQLSPFTFEVLLCNYRQSFKGKYPGRGHDSELAYFLEKAEPYWKTRGGGSDFFETRALLWDPRCLGEFQGWTGVRKAVGETINRYGYYWSDREYDYVNTVNLEHPAVWTPVIGSN